jgi:hypothetical protein
MSHHHSASLFLACTLALTAMAGCGDDDSPTGGDGGGSSALSFNAGTYALSGEFLPCGEQVPFDFAVDTLTFCQKETTDDFFGYDCPVRRTGNTLSLDCVRTFERSSGCMETVRITATGTVTDDHYELFATFEYSDDPAGCWDDSYCDSLYLTVDRISGVPTACAYADENTVALSVVGGPQAGSHTLFAFGNGSQSGPNVAYSFNASTSIVAARDRAATGEGATIFLSANTSYLDPESLPATLPVIVQVPLASAATAAGGPEVLLTYYEQNLGNQFFAESVVTGNFVVHEIDLSHIAGTLAVTVAGTEYNNEFPEGTPAQRTLTGGYYVTGNESTARSESGTLSSALTRLFERRPR